VGRALSLSLAAHAAFVLSFLLLSATRQPLMVPQVARPVRLVTYLEPAAAPRPRSAAVPEPREAPAAPARPAPRIPSPPPAAPTTPAAAPPAPAAVPRIAIPVPAEPPVTRAAVRPALSERLARRLAASAPATSRQEEVAAPEIVRLPRPESAATRPSADTAAPTTAPVSETVEPVGYFPHAWYLAVLKEKIFARWSPPSEFFQSSRPPAALVAFRIDRAGRLGGVTLKEGSGSARFDQSALAAVRGLGQIPPLPEQYREETLDVVIRFQNVQ
jgi:periplasmic protein TonB